MTQNTPPPKPRSIVFDLGKVLVDFDYTQSAARVAARASMPPQEIQWFMHNSPILFRYESGDLTTEQFFEAVCAKTGFDGSLAEFAGFFSDVFTPIPGMVQLHAQLRAHGYRTYIFSNTNELAVRHIRNNFPFFATFDGHVLSYEHGAMKPDHRLYQAVETLSGHSGPELLYLDDLLDNVQSGAQRSWQTIHHKSTDQTVARLHEMSVLPKPPTEIVSSQGTTRVRENR